MKKSLRNENFQQNQNAESENQEKVISSAKSSQSVRNSQEMTYQVELIASTHAAKAEINSADKNAKHFVLVSELDN